MQLPPIIKQVDDLLEGWPDAALSVLLLALAILIGALGLFGPRWVKPIIAAWVIAP